MKENRSCEENPRQGKDSKEVTVVSSVLFVCTSRTLPVIALFEFYKRFSNSNFALQVQRENAPREYHFGFRREQVC